MTPDEFTAALAIIESRRQEEQRRREEEERYLADTIVIGDVVHELDMNVSAEEVWAEVQRQREKDAETKAVEAKQNALPPERDDLTYGHWSEPDSARQPGDTPRMPSALPAKIVASMAGALILITSLVWLNTNSALPYHQPFPIDPPRPIISTFSPLADVPTQFISSPDAEFFRKLELCRGPHPRYHLTRVVMGASAPEIRPGETAYPQRAIPDDYPVYGSPFYLIAGPSLRVGIVFRNASETRMEFKLNSGFNNPWFSSPVYTMTVYHSRIYLRCWIAKSDIGALHQGHALVLYTSASVANIPRRDLVPLSVPLQDLAPLAGSMRGGNLFMPAGRLSNGQNGPYKQSDQSVPPDPRSKGYWIKIPEGTRLNLDSHAWEDFTALNLPAFVPSAWMQQPGALSDHNDSGEYNPFSEFDASSDVVRIGKIPEGRPFRCGLGIMNNIILLQDPSIREPLQRIPLADILVDQRPQLHWPYTLVKHEGHIYFRAWVAARMTEAKMQKHDVALYGDADALELGDSPTQLTLRTDRCRLLTAAGPMIAVASNVHLDKHAWEKWQP